MNAVKIGEATEKNSRTVATMNMRDMRTSRVQQVVGVMINTRDWRFAKSHKSLNFELSNPKAGGLFDGSILLSGPAQPYI